jgi:hypothetical protein
MIREASLGTNREAKDLREILEARYLLQADTPQETNDVSLFIKAL